MNVPLYEYKCLTCGKRTTFRLPAHAAKEVIEATDDLPVECLECGGGRFHRVYTPVGLIFRGSGFHSTDYRGPVVDPDLVKEE